MTNAELFCKENKLNFHFEKLDLILYHSSEHSQTRENRKRNKELQVYGEYVVLSALAIVSYMNKENLSSESMSKMLSSNKAQVAKQVYEDLNFEKYLYISKCEEGNSHVLDVYKLIAFYYMEYGMFHTIKWLKPYMKDLAENKAIDYRTRLLEYTQKRKLSCDYKLLSVEGPQNDQVFTYELIVGKNRIVATGKNKKAAMRAAAQMYIEKRNITVDKNKRETTKTIFDNYYVSKDRKAELREFFHTLNISEKDIPEEYMNVVFTHKSAINENLENVYIDNRVLAVIGSMLIQLYAIEFLFQDADYEVIDVIKEKSAYLNADNFEKAIPSKWVKLLNAAKSVKDLKPKMQGTIKIEIFQSLLAAIMLCAVKNQRKDLEEKARVISNAYLQAVKNIKRPDYMTVLQEIVQKNGILLQKTSGQCAGKKQNTILNWVEITCKKNKWSVTRKETAGTKKIAANFAAEKIIAEIRERSDDAEKEFIDNKIKNIQISNKDIKEENKKEEKTYKKENMLQSVEQIEDESADDVLDELEVTFLMNLWS